MGRANSVASLSQAGSHTLSARSDRLLQQAEEVMEVYQLGLPLNKTVSGGQAWGRGAVGIVF